MFKLLKRSGPFKWTPEAKQALQEIKLYLTSPPVLVVPGPTEPLLLYITATPQVMSIVLVVEQEEDSSGSGLKLGALTSPMSCWIVGSELPSPPEQLAISKPAAKPRIPPSFGLVGESE